MEHSGKASIKRRLLRKPSVVVSLLIIALMTIMAVFAYTFAPDRTPYANNMIVELSAKSPGFEKQFLLVPKTLKPKTSSALDHLWQGTPTPFHWLPINGYHLNADGISVEHYIDDGLQDTLFYSFAQLGSRLENTEQERIVNRRFHLGTDRYGRDILSRLIVGSRVSLSVGLVAVLLSISIGIVLGLVAGYFGGRIDDGVMYLINLLWAIPTLLLVFAITLTIGKGFWEIFIAIGLTMWVSAARLIRGQVKVIRELDYISAARTMGLSPIRIMFRHILPNISGPVMVIAASNFATAILIEAGLSFLGIGVQPPQPSWGLMIKEHYNFLLTNQPMLAIVPGLAILIVVYAFNILGNALRDALDVR